MLNNKFVKIKLKCHLVFWFMKVLMLSLTVLTYDVNNWLAESIYLLFSLKIVFLFPPNYYTKYGVALAAFCTLTMKKKIKVLFL